MWASYSGNYCMCSFDDIVIALAGFGKPSEEDWIDVPMNLSNMRKVNRAMRLLDQSDMWPIQWRFNATDRAINRVRRQGWDTSMQEYILAVDAEISHIVNS
jgi:hypothetical protein